MTAGIKPLLTPTQVADILGIAPVIVRRECAAGRLRAARYGRGYHISEDAVRDYIEQHTAGGVEPVAPARRRRRRAA